jgi:hypothetical protein
MATPADQRLLELLDKWLNSLELHLKYSSLDNDSYSKIQSWPEHQRPSRWIIELAKQKAAALKAQVEERVALGDARFSDSLELMAFLANLVGAEHIERFIPLAHAATELSPDAAAQPGAESHSVQAGATGTREMPKFVAPKERAREPAGNAAVARTERRTAARAPSKPPAEPPAPAATDRETAAAAMHEQVIADAARLVQWGRKWYELAELISGMANRPSLIDVRRILKDNKTVIDKKAGRS